MLLGFTALGGDEPLGGWGVPTRPETLLVTTRIFGLQRTIIDTVCSVAIDGSILDIASPFSTDEFQRNQEFVTEMMQAANCNGLDVELFTPCLAEEYSIAIAKGTVGIQVVKDYRLNAEYGSFGLIQLDVTLAEAEAPDAEISQVDVTWVVVDIIFN